MVNSLKRYCILSLLLIHFSANGQVVVDTSFTAEYLVEKVLLGPGVKVGNVKFTGEKHAISTYLDHTNQLGISKGILLTSGNAYYALGPNKSPRTGWASSAFGDEELEAIARGKTWDAAVLEFDFVTVSENLSFRFVFASEEYLEYVGSKFNDVFGFFISGENVKRENIARLPDGKTPITVNTVNNELNSQYYIDNAYVNTTDPFIWDVRNREVVTNLNYLKEEVPPKYDTQFDGFTTVLEARAKVIPNKVYHIKMAIADVGDGILDSGVFLDAGSFQSSGEIIANLDDHFKENRQADKLAKRAANKLDEIKLPDVHIPKRHRIGQIEFDFDKYHLTPLAASNIVRVYNQWKDTKKARIELIGHTDSHGSHEYNESLSHRRSESVAQMLIELGVPKNLIAVNFMGETSPLKSNETDEGRARNRRVEFYLIY
ncbi:OmpA family protein [Fulvivirga lutea]|uniref:OmpA family protein n=1 Tax=Fulvivirga lutea TaxID=2810512 RepID=A0A974WGQ3_9BACT|nr:OmpA family protein [Fulvivirga lutea]QSE97996.1 OmpA family protein [Fulvivirga lutea]